MKLLIAVIKIEGEERTRGQRGRLVATRTRKNKPAIVIDGHIIWWGPGRTTVEQCKLVGEQLAGPLDWKGFPDFGGLLKGTHLDPGTLKAVAVWREK